MDEVDGGDAEAGRQHPVERRRRAAALHVAEHHDPRLEPGAVADLAGDHVGDAAEAHVAELVVDLLRDLERAGHRLGALGDDDDRGEAAALVAAAEALADLLDVERDLRDQHHVAPPAIPA